MKKRFLLIIAVLIIAVIVVIIGVACKKGDGHKHELVTHQAVKATCLKEGNIEYYSCECGKYFADSEGKKQLDKDSIVVAKLPHSIVDDPAKEPTCTAVGYTAGTHCTDCNLPIIIQNKIPPLGHDVVVDKAVAPTCTEDGLTEGSHCARCSVILQRQKVVDALGHTIVFKSGYPATLGVAGLTDMVYCSTCDEVLKESSIIPALVESNISRIEYLEENEYGYFRHNYIIKLFAGDNFTFVDKYVNAFNISSERVYDGKLVYLNEGIYKLLFNQPFMPFYVKFYEGVFDVCNSDGSPWEYKFVDSALDVRQGNRDYGYKDLQNNPNEKLQSLFYARLLACCEYMAFWQKDIPVTDGKCIIDRINLQDAGLTEAEATAVYKVFVLDNPLYYWLVDEPDFSDGCFNLTIDPTYAAYSYREECDRAIMDMTIRVYQLLVGELDDLTKAITIHNFIVDNFSIALAADGITISNQIWAKNLVGGALYKAGTGLCYAKVFQYLCTFFELDCLTVTGKTTFDHAWNYICLDNAWYAVDCMYDDVNGENPYYYYFGLNKSEIGLDHNADNSDEYGLSYLYRLPELSEERLQICKLYQDQEDLGYMPNIDAAFSKMLSTDKEYTIQLFDYLDRKFNYLYGYISPYEIKSTQTPNVKKLTINGVCFDAGSEYYYFSRLDFENLTAKSTLELSDLNAFSHGQLDLEGNTLITSGRQVAFYCEVIGGTTSENKSVINCNTTYETIFKGNVDVFGVYGKIAFVSFFKDCVLCELSANTRVYWSELFDVKRFIVNNENGNSIFFQLEYDEKEEFGVNIKIGNIDSTLVSGNKGTLHIVNTFGNVDKFVPIQLVGKINCNVVCSLLGQKVNVITDGLGNVVDTYIEICDPLEIELPILIVNDLDNIENISINVDNIDLVLTDYYDITDKGEVIRKK